MSTYGKITRHPQTGQYEQATWHDDYYGSHSYGVEFPSDGKVYPPEMVDNIKEFWVKDVADAAMITFDSNRTRVIEFLNLVNKAYKDRWKRDPECGEGAVEYEQSKHNRVR